MTDSIRLGRLAGIPFGVHWSLLVFAGVAVWNLTFGFFPYVAPDASAVANLAAAVVGVAGLFVSILAHELGHAVIARRRGVGVDGITLWMLGGVARLRTEAPSAGAAAAIAGAGPAVSIGLGATLAGATVVADTLGAGALGLALLTYLAFINMALAVFNLIPALPLDGGRLYQAWLWRRSGDRHRATVQAAGLGRLLGWALVVLGLVQVMYSGFSGFWLVLLGGFVVSLAATERRRARAQIRRRARPAPWFAPVAAGPVVIDVRADAVDRSPGAPPPVIVDVAEREPYR